MNKISVTVITLNEEKNIERCLNSVKWADEIVVLDGFSQDRTIELCRRFTDKIFQEAWLGYGKQKNLCAAKASYQWILNLDADEEVSSDCAEEIREKLDKELNHPLYLIPRKNFFGGRWVRFGGWYPDRIARLYDKTRVAFTEVAVHEELFPNGNGGYLVHSLKHYSYSDTEDYISRQNYYSTLSAQEMVRNGKIAEWWDLCLRPLWAFVKAYFFRQGFREGFLGFFLAAAAGFYTFLKYAKTRSV